MWLETGWSVIGTALEADKKQGNKIEKYPPQLKFRIHKMVCCVDCRLDDFRDDWVGADVHSKLRHDCSDKLLSNRKHFHYPKSHGIGNYLGKRWRFCA